MKMIEWIKFNYEAILKFSLVVFAMVSDDPGIRITAVLLLTLYL